MALNEQFIEACRIGDLESVREIYMLNPTIDISANGEIAFIEACYNGHLEVVRQLYQWRPTMYISAHNEQVF